MPLCKIFSQKKALKLQFCTFRTDLECLFLLLNPLPNDKNWALTKLKALADDKFNVAKMLIFLFDGVENIVGKVENAGYQHFLLFLQCFQKASFLKVGIVWERVKTTGVNPSSKFSNHIFLIC